MVGCVIARGERMIGEGFHVRAGLAHAEREALAACSEDPAGATMYVTLEPCSHVGRTPPCVDAVIEARVARVVIAMQDPNPLVNGEGVRRLRDAGIDVVVGIGESAAQRLNEKFVTNCREQRPFVLLKAAMTLDAKLATVARRSQWITGPEAREQSLRLREEYDAILVGSGTVSADDPQLTRRLGLSSAITPWTRVVVDSTNALPRQARVLHDGGRTIVYSAHPEELGETTAELVRIDVAKGGADLRPVLADLFERGVRSIIAEGGAVLHTSLIEQKLWDKMVIFVAPMIVGGAEAPALFGGAGGIAELGDAHRFRFDSVETVGADLAITAYPK